jgi:hypothetical protein
MAPGLLVRLLTHLRDDLRAQVRGASSEWLERLRRRWKARPPPARQAAQLLVVALLALGLASLDARARLAGRLPSPLDWRALAALLERDARPGDLVAIQPPWLERARLLVPARLPVLGSSALDTEWLPGVRRVWLVAAGGVTSFGPRLPLAGRATAQVTQQVGQLQVTRLDLASPLLPLASLPEQSGTPTRWREVQGVARRCMELSPGAGGRASLELPALTLGGALAGHAALRPSSARGRGRLRIRVDTEAPVTFDTPSGREWRPFRVDTLRFANTPRRLILEAETPPGTSLCVEALLLP